MFWQRSKDEVTSDTLARQQAGLVDPATAGKGRPTPTRKEAEITRKTQMRPPRDRREAAKIQRDKAKVDRLKSRAALVSGDERYLPARDRGAVRKYARDMIDSRRSLGEYFLFLGFAIVLMSFTGNGVLLTYASGAWLVLLIVLIGEAVLTSRRVTRTIDARYPPEKGPYEGRKGVGFYAVMRNFQLRRMRLPKPTVKPGTKA